MEVPDWFIAVVMRLLSSAPADRFSTPAELIDHLARPGGSSRTRRSAAGEERPQPRGLVVLPFENASGQSGDDWLGHALADRLGRSLAEVPSVYVAAVDQFLETLERVRRRGQGTPGEQLQQAGRLSGAATLIRGSFRRAGDAMELRVEVQRPSEGSSSEIEAVRGELSALADVESRLLSRVARALDLQTPATVTAPNVTSRDTLAAQERFFTAQRHFLRGDYESALQIGKEAIALDASFGDAPGLVGGCYARMGRYDEAMEYHRQQQRLASQEGNERLAIQALANLGAMQYFRGEFDAAEEYLREAARRAEESGLTTELAQIRNNSGFVLLQLGRQAEAGEAFRCAIETLKRYGALVALVGPYNGIGHVLREQKRYEEARGYFHRALSLAQESDDAVNMGVAFMNLGQCALLQGRLADAKHELAVAQNILEKTSFWNGLARVYEYMADLNLRLSNWTEAVRCAEQRIELARRHANSRMEAAAQRQRAEALTRAPRPSTMNERLPRIDTGE